MNDKFEQIISKYKEFKQYLDDLDDYIFEETSRQELMELNKKIRDINNFRYLTLDIDKIIKKKKEKEYPQLLDVHNYPEIKELDCLSNEDKINLDKYLVSLRQNDYISQRNSRWYNLTKSWDKEIKTKVLNFLENKRIIEKLYILDVCHDTRILNKEKLNKYLRYFELQKVEKTELNWDEYYNLEMELEIETYCCDCDDEVVITENMIIDAENSSYSWIYKIIKKRDKTLDNV